MSTICPHRAATASSTTLTAVAHGIRHRHRLPPGLREILLLGALYGVYSIGRVFASGDVASAVAQAGRILDLETLFHLDVEHAVNNLFAAHRWLEVPASFYYASAHYVVTPVVLVWLWFGHRMHYPAARRALAAATVVALTLYITVPTAPPRLVGGYHDLLAATAGIGWWSTSASAPQGLGGLTNELAAMPSMHVGWALWCALTIQAYAAHRGVRVLGWLHAALTTAVVVGTGNHWTLDVVAGAALVSLAWALLVTHGPSYAEVPTRVSAGHGTP